MINIVKNSIDINVLNHFIFNFKLTPYYRENSYLIMNKETNDVIESEFKNGYTIYANGFTTYQGIRIAICEGLKFGEIEIK